MWSTLTPTTPIILKAASLKQQYQLEPRNSTQTSSGRVRKRTASLQRVLTDRFPEKTIYDYAPSASSSTKNLQNPPDIAPASEAKGPNQQDKITNPNKNST
ncbi:hypothetical protein JMJ77_0003890 [Colletotrichum scovillei]|uniref:Uncharacterized protein n=1 Tax=Colletotrichum scovillei TaxID=1209932 RepID=A0A9P7U8K9_9PEZI|nr:hypothetical protein JMJ77_0003890 [Colletotrichum scovillei]KAG7049139.1 hypothetical protein JMJ78_0013122 [Colletotrichum scovillei]KAG7063880.1 hypothetical protein JMJ76_0006928 [Colletotrichum scovillei]